MKKSDSAVFVKVIKKKLFSAILRFTFLFIIQIFFFSVFFRLPSFMAATAAEKKCSDFPKMSFLDSTTTSAKSAFPMESNVDMADGEVIAI